MDHSHVAIDLHGKENTLHVKEHTYRDVPSECADVLTFWFGPGDQLIYNGGLWWRGIMNSAQRESVGNTENERRLYTDKYIEETWGKAIQSDIGVQWSKLSSPLGAIGAIILYDQLSRQAFRGTKKAFEFDHQACSIANQLLQERPDLFKSTCVSLDNEHSSEYLPWTYQLFVYFALLHSENFSYCEKGACGLANLYEILKTGPEFKESSRMWQILKSAKQHMQVLAKFGRYPHRNIALGRESTEEELAFLQENAKTLWMRSQIPFEGSRVSPLSDVVSKTTPNTTSNTKKVTKIHSKTQAKNGFRILVLHSNRQSPSTFQKRTRDVFARAVGPGSTLVYASAPHKYVARGEALNNTKHLQASNQSTTRCWWNASDDPATMVYTGMEETIKHIDEIAKNNGPFDGIIGFSQGATLAGLLAALVSDKSPLVSNLSDKLQFVVMISGFYVRDTRPEFSCLNGPLRDKTNPINIPSFHVWGLSDTLVLPDRSEALRDSFASQVNGVGRVTQTHQLDHYKKAIAVWPVDKIREWILANFKPHNVSSIINETLQEKLFAVRDKRYEIVEAKENMIDDEIALIVQTLESSEDDLIIRFSDDPKDIVNVVLLERKIFRPKNHYISSTADLLVKLANKYFNIGDIGDIVNWTQKVKIVLSIFPNMVTSFYTADKRVNVFRQGIVDTVCQAIETSFDRKNCNFIASNLPNGNNKHFKKNGLLADIVNRFQQFWTYHNDGHFAGKLDVESSYSTLCKALEPLDLDKIDHTGEKNRAVKIRKGARTPEDLEKLLYKPFSDAIVNPIPEPVDIAPEKEMQPLHDFLRSEFGKKFISNHTTIIGDDNVIGDNIGGEHTGELVFSRGTLCQDGRLDLCKQVIGPGGVDDLELSLQIDGSSATPKVKHLLLGNNIAGSGLAKAVAKLIRNKSTAITTWYIAGNNLDASITPVAEAMEHDTFVQQLWLKRNPLKLAGAIPISKMLGLNTFLKVLDLTNTGLMDNGTKIVCNAITNNKMSGLKILYLNSNGITTESLSNICEMLCSSRLSDIGLGANRIGDKGCALLADTLDNSTYEVLELSSCGIGSKGVEMIAKKLISNTTLRKLDLGFLKSTEALGEIPNVMGNQGASALASALKHNRTLLSLNLLHNGIYQQGVSDLANALIENTTLLHLNIEQLGIPHNELTRESIRISLKRNHAELTDEQRKVAMTLINRDHLSEVKSVYRIESNE